MFTIHKTYFEEYFSLSMSSSVFLTDSSGGIGFSGTAIISEGFFNFCLPIILFVFLLKVVHDYRRRKKRLARMFQDSGSIMTSEKEES